LLKQKLCEAPVLHSPNLSHPFAVHCDVSLTGVGGVLKQTDDEGQREGERD